MNVAAPLPPAWMGYKFDFTGEGSVLVRICMDCEGRREAEAEAARLKCRVTHGVCPRHFQARMAAITGEKL